MCQRHLGPQSVRDALSGQYSALSVAKAGKGYARRQAAGIDLAMTEGCKIKYPLY